MSFLNPLFLFALIAVGLPLLIHLLNLRKPQKIAFSTLAFFQELKNTTIKRIRIKKYLLLFLRLAAIICLALVLARPFLPPGLSGGGNSQAPALNAILLDNSISMSRIGNEGPLFDYAKKIIGEIEQASKEDDRFVLQVTNGEAESSSILNHANLQKILSDLEITPSGNFSANRLTALVEMLEEAPYSNKKIFIVSDGQSSQFSQLQELDDENIVFTFIDVGEVPVQNTMVENISTSTNMIGTNIPFTMNVDVVNRGEVQAVNQFVSLQFEGESAGQYSLSLQPGESKTFTFEVNPSKTGSSKGQIFIEGDDFQADNEYYFTVQIPETRKILWIKGREQAGNLISYTGAMLQAAGENDAQLSYDEASPDILETVNLTDYDAVILDGVEEIPEYTFQPLQRFVQEGNGLVFFPSEVGNLNNYNNFLSQFNAGRFAGIQGEYSSFNSIASADELLEDHPAFSGLFDREADEQVRFTRPNIYYYLKLNPNNSGTGFDLLSLNNGDVLIHEKRFGQGNLLISAIGNDPGWSNFPVKPLFAPFYYRMMLFAASSDEGGFLNHQLGNQFSWTGNIDAENAVIRTDDEEIKPTVNVVSSGIQITYSAQEWQPGWITISDGNREVILSANLVREESMFTETSENELQSLLRGTKIAMVDAARLDEEELQNKILSSGFGREIWNWFMLAGLLFLIAETLTSLWYKTET
ncbi:MAG: BatA domain-containing protein [Balneolaceae bacterium]